MNQNKTTPTTEPISSRKLIYAALGAAAGAGLLLLTVILPAESGIDPLGTGRLLGLTALGQSKQNNGVADSVGVAPVAVAEAATPTATPEIVPASATDPIAAAIRNDRIELVLQPGRGTEVKATMQIGQEMAFAWKTDGEKLYFDFHGDEFNAPKDVFTSYQEGTENQQQGTFKATFGGVHGWYWKNRSSAPVRIELTTSGSYEQIRQL